MAVYINQINRRRAAEKATLAEVNQKTNERLGLLQRRRAVPQNDESALRQVLEALEMDLAKFHHGDYSIGEPTFIKDGKTCFKATGKPVDEEPSGD